MIHQTNSDDKQRPLKIAIVHTSDHGGGAEASSLSLLNALNQLGHQARLYVGTKKKDHPEITEIKRFRVFPGLLRGARLLEERFGWQYLYHPWFRRLDQLMGDQVDVVHFQSLWSGRDGYADVGGLPRLTKKYPSLLTLRDFWVLTGHCACPALQCERWKTGCGKCPDLTIEPKISADGTRFNWKRKRRNFQKAQMRVTTVSHWLADQVNESPMFEGKQIDTVHNGIDETAFFPRDRDLMRRKLGLPLNEFIVMVAGQTIEGTSGKGTSASECALGALKFSEVTPYILAVGHSGARFLKQWGGPGKSLDFINNPVELGDVYGAADVVLVASLWETFGRIPAEAQMCGIPVVAFGTGGIPEIVVHEETGLIAERLNFQQLGDALRKAYKSPDFLIHCREKSSQRAIKLFGNRSIARKYIELYRKEILIRRESST